VLSGVKSFDTLNLMSG